MSEDSKKRQELFEQLTNVLRKKVKDGVKLDFLERLKAFVSSPKNWDLVERVALPASQVETQKFLLCFDSLNEEECNLSLTQGQVKALLALLKQITNMEVNALPSSRIVRDSIPNAPPYSSLFRKLSPDVSTLLETELGEGRVFFFTVGNKFHMVSVEANHRNID
jgi:regulator of RNase E activity RraB